MIEWLMLGACVLFAIAVLLCAAKLTIGLSFLSWMWIIIMLGISAGPTIMTLNIAFGLFSEEDHE